MTRRSKPAARLEAVLAYENERVVRDFTARRGIERAEARSLFRELLKLLWLCNAREVPRSYAPILHELWREMVVHTEEYERFCAQHFGRTLHHDPDAVVDPSKARSDAELDAAITLVYTALGRDTASLWFDTLPRRYPAARWVHYHSVTRHDPPSRALTSALRRFERRPRARRRLAVDLGCGAGRDTRELLARGWRVHAIDGEPSALTGLLQTLEPDRRADLTLHCTPFERLERLPRCDLINAALALPFCPPDAFPRVWSAICRALRGGGRFCGDFLGDTDPWAARPGMTSHSAAGVRELLTDFRIEWLKETDSVGSSAAAGTKRWHLISVVARRAVPAQRLL